MAVYRIEVNGEQREVNVEPDTPLLWALRDSLALTGTKYGCGVAQCGACTVHADGTPVRSCSVPVSAVGARRITTIEGAPSPEMRALQQAWVEHDVPQCGYCQAGMLMTAAALLRTNRNPAAAHLDAALRAHICRCATYVRIRAAVLSASESLRTSSTENSR